MIGYFDAVTIDRADLMRGPSIHDEIVRAHILALARFNDDRLRDLLGQWVSELEPSQITRVDGTLLGLGFSGDPECRIIVPVRP